VYAFAMCVGVQAASEGLLLVILSLVKAKCGIVCFRWGCGFTPFLLWLGPGRACSSWSSVGGVLVVLLFPV
jgi:hypothetical protein